jgi:hypothetical protein
MTMVLSANLDTFWELGLWNFQTNQDLETVRIVWLSQVKHGMETDGCKSDLQYASLLWILCIGLLWSREQ